MNSNNKDTKYNNTVIMIIKTGYRIKHILPTEKGTFTLEIYSMYHVKK